MEQVTDLIKGFQITKEKGLRRIKCAHCDLWINKSILPHIKEKHADVWHSWQREFVDLWNEGFTCKEIMKRFGTLFTWSVIEQEIQIFGEKNPNLLNVHPKGRITEWRPQDFKLEKSTVWGFRKRGDWAVHCSDYRGNWAPQIPRNLVLLYSKPKQAVLDPFVGGGTTLIECYLEGRNGIGVDINPWAIKMTNFRLNELRQAAQNNTEFDIGDADIRVKKGDARELDYIEDESIDLICAHPPYGSALRYTFYEEKDLSHINDTDEFLLEMKKVADELYRVLSPTGKCAVLIGDIRKKGRFIPLEYLVMEEFKRAKFKLWERIIKLQYHDKSTAFYLDLTKEKKHWIAHEYLLLFNK
jgi:ubiquinone/menaquinone biosynthesis C-methylase UbiE